MKGIDATTVHTEFAMSTLTPPAGLAHNLKTSFTLFFLSCLLVNFAEAIAVELSYCINCIALTCCCMAFAFENQKHWVGGDAWQYLLAHERPCRSPMCIHTDRVPWFLPDGWLAGAPFLFLPLPAWAPYGSS